MRKFLNRLRRDTRGSMLIETAFVAPMLITMSLAGVEVSSIIARQHELQSAASNAAEIIVAAEPKTSTERTEIIAAVGTYLEKQTKLKKVAAFDGPNQIRVYRLWRCGNTDGYKTEKSGCITGTNVSAFLVIEMKENYTPVWTKFHLGRDMKFHVKRTVQIG